MNPKRYAPWLERFDTLPNGCWVWAGCLTKAGYGEFMVGGKMSYAHRRFYEHFVGPIPQGLHIDHLCRNRACVNPSHLEPVTCRENLSRSPIAPSTVNREKTHCVAGHLLDAENTHIYPSPYGPQRQCRTCKRERMNRYRREAGIPSRGPRGPYGKRTK